MNKRKEGRVDLDIALNLSTSSKLSVDSPPLLSGELWLLEKFLLEKWSAEGANLEERKLRQSIHTMTVPSARRKSTEETRRSSKRRGVRTKRRLMQRPTPNM